MNPILSAFERIFIGADPHPSNEPLLDFRNGEKLTRNALTEGVLVIASINKGKTTLLRTPLRAMLRDGFGGLIPVVKGSLVPAVVEFARAENRERDVIVLGSGTQHVFNPLEHEASAAEAAALLAELSEVLAGRARDGVNEAFWREQLAIILRHLFTLCRIGCGRLDLLVAAELFDARANTVAEVADPVWRSSSRMARAMDKAGADSTAREAREAMSYFMRTFPTHGDRLQGSLAATVSGVFDHLRRSPLCELFTGKSTFSMEDLFERGKICVVGLPVLDSAAGRIANALLLFCFCRAAVRRRRENYSFLVLDECQELVTHELMEKLAVLREFKVATMLLTQNLAVLDERIGETAREGLCGLMGTKIFGPQGHAATRQWASEQIGKHKVRVRTTTRGSSANDRGSGWNHSTSVHEHWDYRVAPIRFGQLRVGHTVVLRDGRVWRSRWHKDRPGRSATVGIV